MSPEDTPFVTNLADVPVVQGLRRDEGWVDMRVQFLVDKATAGSDDFLLGWTVLPPARCTTGTGTSTATSSGSSWRARE